MAKMPATLIAFLVGLVFALGLGLGGMLQPSVVIGFLDITGNFNPQLALVMLTALAVYVPVYRRTLKLDKPQCASAFQLPTSKTIDARLLGGSAVFGIGWGLAGFCPGPALAALGGLMPEAYVMVVGMTLGIFAADLLTPAVKVTARPSVHGWFDKATSTMTYAVYDPETRDAVIIDPVADYDPVTGTSRDASAAAVVAYVRERQLKVHYVIETHAHADHLTGAQLVKAKLGGTPVAINERITSVQNTFKEVLGLPSGFATDGRQFDRLMRDGETVQAGSLAIKVIPTPGHTSACTTYLIGDAAFCGDAMFMPDGGTGRCDFPGGDAATLYKSIKERLYTLPESTRLFVGHDYQPGGRPLRYETTIGEQRRANIHLTDATTEADYVAFRTGRDKTLAQPKLIDPSLRANLVAGKS